MKVFDLHIGFSDSEIVKLADAPKQFDTTLAKNGGVDAFCGMICAVVYQKGRFVLPQNSKSELQKHIRIYENLNAEGKLSIIFSRSDLLKKGLKVILGVEGIYFVKSEKDLDFLRELIDRGVRIIGPQWNLESNLFTKSKLTPMGKKFLEVCFENKIILDLAHSEDSVFDLLSKSYRGPIIDSHTNLWFVYNHVRNIRLGQIRTIIERDGLIGLSFVGEFLGGTKLADVCRHIKAFLNEFGDANLAIGSDFSGMEQSDVVENLKDASQYDNLQTFLIDREVSKQSVKKIFYENAYTFFSARL